MVGYATFATSISRYFKPAFGTVKLARKLPRPTTSFTTDSYILFCSFTVCTACQSRYISVRARENFQAGQIVQLIPAEMGNYRDFSDASGGPLVLGQQEPIESVSDNRVRHVLALALIVLASPLFFNLTPFVNIHLQSAWLVVRPSGPYIGIQQQSLRCRV